MYMSLLGQPTGAFLNTYPHVLLACAHEWDASVLEYTHPTTSGEGPGLQILLYTVHMIPG